MTKPKCLTAVERARRKKIRALVNDARDRSMSCRGLKPWTLPRISMSRLLDDLADVAEKYLEEVK